MWSIVLLSISQPDFVFASKQILPANKACSTFSYIVEEDVVDWEFLLRNFISCWYWVTDKEGELSPLDSWESAATFLSLKPLKLGG